MKPDLDAIRARCEAAQVIFERSSVVAPCVYDDIPALLAHIDTLEHMLAEERENVDTLRAAVEHAEQRFVDEYDARRDVERQRDELQARIAVLEAMR